MTTNVIHGVKVLSPATSGNNIVNLIYSFAKEIIITAKAISETRQSFYSYPK